jgi:hypothetical protein
MPSAVFECPSELLFAFCSQVYFAGLPAPSQSLDPLITNDYGIPTSLPSSVPAGNWSEQLSRRTLASLCLVNHAWYEAAKPWLWRRLQVRLPRTWLSIVEEIAGSEDEDVSVKQAALAVGHSIKAATDAAMASTVSDGTLSDKETARKLEERILASLSGPDGAIPMELLSPPASRDPSPRRLRTKKSASPARWKIMKSICNAVQNVMNCREPGVYGVYLLHPLCFQCLPSPQCQHPTILDPDVTSVILTLTTSEPLECGDRSRKGSTVASSQVNELNSCSR